MAARRGIRWQLRRLGLPLLAAGVIGAGAGGVALATSVDDDAFQQAFAADLQEMLDEQCLLFESISGADPDVVRAVDRAALRTRESFIREQLRGRTRFRGPRDVFSAVIDPGTPRKCDSRVVIRDPADEVAIIGGHRREKIMRVFMSSSGRALGIGITGRGP